MSRANLSTLKPPADDDDEVVWGDEEIGRVINRTARQVYTLNANKKKNGIPIDVVGHRTHKSTRGRLRRWAAGNAQSESKTD
jgi:hypothetical protein